jgi:hypothetical protein
MMTLRSAARLVLPFIVACGRAPETLPTHPTNSERVSFSLPSNDGALVTIPLASPTLTVLDFFGPSCEPCATRVPEIVRRREAIESRGAKLVLVAVLADGETSSDAENALARWGAKAPFLVDTADVSRREAAIRGLPATLVIDAKGVVRWRAAPTASADDVVAAVR